MEWSKKDIRAIDTKTRKALITHKLHLPPADVYRLYVTRKKGGRGVRQVETAFKSCLMNMKHYLEEKAAEYPYIRMVLEKDRKAPAKGCIGKQAHNYSAEKNFVHFKKINTITYKEIELKN